VDNNVITIDAKYIEIAQNLCSSISNDNLRSRAVANVLAAKLAESYFSSKNYDTDAETGLHNIPKITENLDIADIYVNGSYVDVRLYFSSNEISVPKYHFDLNVNPVVYMFIQLSSDLSNYKVTGFIRPEHIDKNNLKDDYYYIDENSLVSIYDIESNLTKVLDTFDGSKEILYKFVDGAVDEINTAEFFEMLISSANARKTLIKAFKANSLFKFVSVVPEEADNGNYINNQEQNNGQDLYNEQDSSESPYEDDLDDIFNNSTEINDDIDNYSEYSTEVTHNISLDTDRNETEGHDEVTEFTDDELAESGFESTENAYEETDTTDEQIDTLFTGEQEGVPTAKKKKNSFTAVLVIFLLLAAGGYFAYTNFFAQNESSLPDNMPAVTNNSSGDIDSVPPANNVTKNEEAMPNENVNTENKAASTEEASTVAIPAIEQHLDASVLVSNLRVDWEVPAGYASNTAAKRYLVKLGKIIQLNLKSELLLLNKPPISNKITVELTFNSNTGKFEIVGIKDSSGEKTVDNTITTTIKNALGTSISSNTDSFGKLKGNPILIIHL